VSKISEESNFQNKDVLTLEEASQLFQVSTKTFLKMLREEEIPARKVGREWRFSKAALLNWISNGNSMHYATVEEQHKAYFDQMAPVYDELRKNCYGEALSEILINRFPLPRNAIVADLGTGTGYLAKKLSVSAAKVLAIDLSAVMLKVAEAEFMQAKINNIELHESDAHDLPFTDEHLDLTFANLLLHHLSEPALAIREWFRVLRPGGQVVICDVLQHHYGWLQSEKFDFWLGFDTSQVRIWLTNAGFIEVESTPLNCSCRTSSKTGIVVTLPLFLASGKKPI